MINMFEKKYRYQLNGEEYTFIIKSIINLKNTLIQPGALY